MKGSIVMTFSVSVDMNREFDVQSDYDKIFDVLSDVPVSVSHFPKVEQLVDLGDHIYRWEMVEVGFGRYSIQTVYACKYENSREEGWVKWTPVKDVGNALIEGSWNIREVDGRILLHFHTKGTLTLPLPSLIKTAIKPVATREFEGLVDQYIENLKKTFE